MSEQLSQQEFLRSAMRRLGMTQDQFAARIGSSRRALDNWLLPCESKGFRQISDVAWKFVSEIMENDAGGIVNSNDKPDTPFRIAE
jgi:hypothetical protein